MSRAHGHALDLAQGADLAAVEAIASLSCLDVNSREICVDGKTRMRVFGEALKLRVMRVATRFATNDGLGQQRLAPQGYQPLRVKIFRVQ